jgi:hypothetical protein
MYSPRFGSKRPPLAAILTVGLAALTMSVSFQSPVQAKGGGSKGSKSGGARSSAGAKAKGYSATRSKKPKYRQPAKRQTTKSSPSKPKYHPKPSYHPNTANRGKSQTQPRYIKSDPPKLKTPRPLTNNTPWQAGAHEPTKSWRHPNPVPSKPNPSPSSIASIRKPVAPNGGKIYDRSAASDYVTSKTKSVQNYVDQRTKPVQNLLTNAAPSFTGSNGTAAGGKGVTGMVQGLANGTTIGKTLGTSAPGKPTVGQIANTIQKIPSSPTLASLAQSASQAGKPITSPSQAVSSAITKASSQVTSKNIGNYILGWIAEDARGGGGGGVDDSDSGAADSGGDDSGPNQNTADVGIPSDSGAVTTVSEGPYSADNPPPSPNPPAVPGPPSNLPQNAATAAASMAPSVIAANGGNAASSTAIQANQQAATPIQNPSSATPGGSITTTQLGPYSVPSGLQYTSPDGTVGASVSPGGVTASASTTAAGGNLGATASVSPGGTKSAGVTYTNGPTTFSGAVQQGPNGGKPTVTLGVSTPTANK